MTLAISSVTSPSSNQTRATETRPKTKFPPRTESLLPKTVGADGALHRRVEASMTSSWRREAVWSSWLSLEVANVARERVKKDKTCFQR
jgi:hypothetical protein